MKRISVIFALVAPLLYNLWVLWLDAKGALPELLATHWNAAGTADGFASVGEHLIWTNFALFLASGMVLITVLLPSIHSALRKLLLVIVGYFAIFIYGLMIYVVWAQVGITDASNARVGLEILWFILPVLLLIPISLSRPKLVISDRIRVQLWGLTVLTLDYSEIESLSSKLISPSEFGGWGLRFSRGAVAFIPSKGPALSIATKKGEVILIRSNQVENLIAAITPKI